ncbi:MAG: hypothetical protein JOS17DRAFT_259730 [Linnemannia elongata]|nr:MAG: hypothetical protein JOS17DRAFT_259730 [Linnemannia elongata]
MSSFFSRRKSLIAPKAIPQPQQHQVLQQQQQQQQQQYHQQQHDSRLDLDSATTQQHLLSSKPRPPPLRKIPVREFDAYSPPPIMTAPINGSSKFVPPSPPPYASPPTTSGHSRNSYYSGDNNNSNQYYQSSGPTPTTTTTEQQYQQQQYYNGGATGAMGSIPRARGGGGGGGGGGGERDREAASQGHRSRPVSQYQQDPVSSSPPMFVNNTPTHLPSYPVSNSNNNSSSGNSGLSSSTTPSLTVTPKSRRPKSLAAHEFGVDGAGGHGSSPSSSSGPDGSLYYSRKCFLLLDHDDRSIVHWYFNCYLVLSNNGIHWGEAVSVYGRMALRQRGASNPRLLFHSNPLWPLFPNQKQTNESRLVEFYLSLSDGGRRGDHGGGAKTKADKGIHKGTQTTNNQRTQTTSRRTTRLKEGYVTTPLFFSLGEEKTK